MAIDRIAIVVIVIAIIGIVIAVLYYVSILFISGFWLEHPRELSNRFEIGIGIESNEVESMDGWSVDCVSMFKCADEVNSFCLWSFLVIGL